MKKCSSCLLPETNETMVINDNVCNLCTNHKNYQKKINWVERKKKLKSIANKLRNKSGYDCIVPFSGGKDSIFQVHYVINELKLKPLIVRFNHGFIRPNMKKNVDVFLKKIGADFLDFNPNWHIVKFLLEESFRRKGDFCWHCHTGIFAYPLRLAVSFNIKLVIYGEPQSFHSEYYNFDEFEKEDIEKFDMLRTLGISSKDMIGMINSRHKTNFTIRDLEPFTFPDNEIFKKKNITPINLGNYIKWDVEKNYNLINKKYNWQTDSIESVPDELNPYGAKIECFMQGSRDYIKYLKRGYSRIDQNIAHLLRTKKITVEKAKKILEIRNIKEPPSLQIFLDYINMSKKEFYSICKKMQIQPFNENFEEDIEIDTKLHDYNIWYKEK